MSRARADPRVCLRLAIIHVQACDVALLIEVCLRCPFVDQDARRLRERDVGIAATSWLQYRAAEAPRRVSVTANPAVVATFRISCPTPWHDGTDFVAHHVRIACEVTRRRDRFNSAPSARPGDECALAAIGAAPCVSFLVQRRTEPWPDRQDFVSYSRFFWLGCFVVWRTPADVIDAVAEAAATAAAATIAARPPPAEIAVRRSAKPLIEWRSAP